MIVECHAPVGNKRGWYGNNRVDRDVKGLKAFSNIVRKQVVNKNCWSGYNRVDRDERGLKEFFNVVKKQVVCRMEDVDLEVGWKGVRTFAKRVFQELIGRLDNILNA